MIRETQQLATLYDMRTFLRLSNVHMWGMQAWARWPAQPSLIAAAAGEWRGCDRACLPVQDNNVLAYFTRRRGGVRFVCGPGLSLGCTRLVFRQVVGAAQPEIVASTPYRRQRIHWALRR